MRRPFVLLAVAALAGCQEYQYTPVGRCVLQPGSASIATVAATDLLFVVDDSHSMSPIQASLASNLGTFINRLAQKQQDRVRQGKDPFDVHIAVTSTSVLVNRNTGEIATHYYNYVTGYCTPGVLKANGDPYPGGSFLAAASNPTMLSFTKDLDWGHSATDPTIQRLITMFKQNVQVGDCGANQEMPFEAARQAVIKGVSGAQGVGWPHANSKLALVFVGNEDDCSTPPANQGGLVWDGGQAGIDNCKADAQNDPPLHGLTPYRQYLDFLTGLGRPLSVAFVRPGFQDCVVDDTHPYIPGTRMQKLSTALSNSGANVIEASVCGSFATSLESIADGLQPPDRLRLPTTPAAGQVTRVVIQSEAGETTHVCEGPDPAREWWFIDCDATPPVPLAADRTAGCIELKVGGACQPQPGQKLVAEYLGRVPASGCSTSGDCATALGGAAGEWSCQGASNQQKGTCVCSGSSR
jgi:hypothetical protein